VFSESIPEGRREVKHEGEFRWFLLGFMASREWANGECPMWEHLPFPEGYAETVDALGAMEDSRLEKELRKLYEVAVEREEALGEEIDLDNPPVGGSPAERVQAERVTITITYDPNETKDVTLQGKGPLDDLAAAAAEAGMRQIVRLFTAPEYND
jgi:hypothetical protein